VKFGIRYRNTVLVNVYDFCEYWLGEDRAFLVRLNVLKVKTASVVSVLRYEALSLLQIITCFITYNFTFYQDICLSAWLCIEEPCHPMSLTVYLEYCTLRPRPILHDILLSMTTLSLHCVLIYQGNKAIQYSVT
jgi:hypothetical protein